ncbi:DUF7546 family protein [Natrinema caseinilyticum]|uniref:DUF7546 family protein n=1 Tax=Natrinema caseinilyticum TaxID=2961570 RepID=UPI0020C47A01|nr:hypothetical protein [Natrinema caseinilyticum]
MHSNYSLETSAFDPRTGVDRRWFGVFAIQVLTFVGYATLAGTGITAIRYLVYPFIWIDAAAWAILCVTPSAASMRA